MPPLPWRNELKNRDMIQTSLKNEKRSGADHRKASREFGRLGYLFSKTRLRAPLRWVRHMGLGPADIFFGSYPRSGSTWTRFVLYEILTGREANFEAVNTTLLGVQRMNHGVPVLSGGGRLVGSHERYCKKYRRALYLVRDGRDVLLSEYAYLSSLGLYRDSLDKFIAGFVGAQGRVNGFGPWQRHASSWLDSPIAGTSDFLLVQYEALRQTPEDSIQRICDFLGVSASRGKIQSALSSNSLSRMREKERHTPQLPSGKEPFVRSGSVQGWRGKLSQPQLELFERHAGSILTRLGYPLSTAQQEAIAVTP
jgi:hypothetical protein